MAHLTWHALRTEQLERLLKEGGGTLPFLPHISDVPVELLGLVFNYLDAPSFERCRDVCQLWQTVIISDVNRVKMALLERRHWHTKVFNEKIVSKWRHEAALQGISATTDLAIKELKRGASPRSYHYRLRGVVRSVGIVPDGLRDRLRAHLGAIAARPDKDFHPGSDGMVQNLIHPSLYCFQEGVTPVATEVDPEPLFQPARYKDFRRCRMAVEEGDDVHAARFRWLPSDVEVDKHGVPRFTSYINNLPDPGTPDAVALTESLEELFRLVLPLFETALAQTFGGYTVRVRSDSSEEEEAQEHRRLPSFSLNGGRLQVVVKAANYILKPGQEYTGHWHVEGVPAEQIVATAIYYYQADDDIHDSGLSFRRERGPDEVDYEEAGNGPPGQTTTLTLPNNLRVGHMDTSEDTVLVFTNNLQHRVDGVRFGNPSPLQHPQWGAGAHLPNAELGAGPPPPAQPNEPPGDVDVEAETPDREARRKILLFWLVDPTKRVVSTANVAAQQDTMTRAQAEDARAQLMKERTTRLLKVTDRLEKEVQREYMFCEH